MTFNLMALDCEELLETFAQVVRLGRENLQRRRQLAAALCATGPTFQHEVNRRGGNLALSAGVEFHALEGLDDIDLALLARVCATARVELRCHGFEGLFWLDLRDAVMDEEVRRFFLESQTQRGDNVL